MLDHRIMTIPCPLCCGAQFSDPGHLLTSVSALVTGPVQCPVDYCGVQCHSLDSLLQHLPCHLQPPEPLPPPSDNIDDVIKDLADLVNNDINNGVFAGGESSWNMFSSDTHHKPPPPQYPGSSSKPFAHWVKTVILWRIEQ